MNCRIGPMTIDDYDEVLALWKACEGIGLSSADSRESIAVFLNRNPGLSCVARRDGQLVGAVLCGHDGRRGYIHHLAVNESCRREGVGRDLVAACLRGLQRIGVQKCHVFVFADNSDAIVFWRGIGWTRRDELTMMSRSIPDQA